MDIEVYLEDVKNINNKEDCNLKFFKVFSKWVEKKINGLENDRERRVV